MRLPTITVAISSSTIMIPTSVRRLSMVLPTLFFLIKQNGSFPINDELSYFVGFFYQLVIYLFGWNEQNRYYALTKLPIRKHEPILIVPGSSKPWL